MIPVPARRHRTPNKAGQGVWKGTVTRVDGDGRPFVEVERYAPGYEFGPLEYLQSVTLPFVVGDRVAVSFVEGRGDAVIVLGRVV